MIKFEKGLHENFQLSIEFENRKETKMRVRNYQGPCVNV
jgi:hypothetical protein